MNLSEIKSVLAIYTKAEQQFRAVYKESGQPITEARLRKMLREDGKVINSSQNYSDEEWFQNGENILVCKHLRYSPVSMHTHSFIEISYMLSGSCKEVIQFIRCYRAVDITARRFFYYSTQTTTFCRNIQRQYYD